MAKRQTPEEEKQRIAERIFNKYGKRINTQKDFNEYFAKMIDTPELTDKQKKLRSETFADYSKVHPVYLTPAKAESISTRIEKGEIIAKGKQTRSIDIPAKIRRNGRVSVVYAERTFVLVKGKEYTRYRDAKGRFVSVGK